MVAKITTGKDIYGALFYNQEKVNKGQGEVLATHIIREPEDGNFSVAQTAEEFLRWMPGHYRTEKPVIHISLNPHEDDNLSDSQLVEISEKYLERLGYGGQPYVIFKHTDIDREHIHIVSVQIRSDGSKIKDNLIGTRSKAVTEELEKEYGLHPAEGRKNTENWQLSPVDPARGNLKKQIAAVIKPALKMYKFQTLGEYRALLSLYNIGVEEVRGTRKGKPYKGLLYTIPDNTRTPLKSSLFGKEFGIDGLEKHMEKSGLKIKKDNVRERTLPRVEEAFGNAPAEEVLRESLRKLHIDLFLRRNDTGRIVGVTFIDHNERCVLNGSRLGKEYSANALNERFAMMHKNEANLQEADKALIKSHKETKNRYKKKI